MTSDAHDPLLSLLAHLPAAAPSAACVDLVRARSLVELEKKFRRARREKRTASGRAVDAALLLACVVYVAAAAIEAIKSGWPLR